MSGGLRRAVLRELLTASAQQTPAGGRNEDKLAQGYKNPACMGRDGIEKATVTDIKGSRDFQHWIRS